MNTTRTSTLLLALGLSLAAAGCLKANYDSNPDDDGDGSTDFCDDASFDMDETALACANGPVCEITGLLPDGRALRESCDGATSTCSLYVEGTLTCTCPSDRIDFASTCPNGAPTCSSWKLNWSTAEICIIN